MHKQACLGCGFLVLLLSVLQHMSVKHLLKMMNVSNLSQPSQILVGEYSSLTHNARNQGWAAGDPLLSPDFRDAPHSTTIMLHSLTASLQYQDCKTGAALCLGLGI